MRELFAKYLPTACCTLLLFSLIGMASSPDITVKEIVGKNVQAAGGMEKLSSVKNLSFQFTINGRLGPESLFFYIRTDGAMKSVLGNDPVIKQVTIVKGDSIKYLDFNKNKKLEPIYEGLAKCFAKLGAGLFTLSAYEKDLMLEGTKRYGPEKNYVLSTSLGKCKATFCVDTSSFLLKRMTVAMRDEMDNKKELVYDFGPYKEINGFKVPSYLFFSMVGWNDSPNTQMDIANLKLNSAYPEAFFSEGKINAGKIMIGKEQLEGNILKSVISPRNGHVFIETNYFPEQTGSLGLKTGHKLTVEAAGKTFEATFIADENALTRELMSEGNILMFRLSGVDSFVIGMFSKKYGELQDTLKPLTQLKIKIKDKSK